MRLGVFNFANLHSSVIISIELLLCVSVPIIISKLGLNRGQDANRELRFDVAMIASRQ